MLRRYRPPARSARMPLSFLNRLSTVTSVTRRPVPTIWVPQNLLSQEMSLFPGVRSPKIAIRFRLCGQVRWSEYDSAIGFEVPSVPSFAPVSGEERLPMYSAEARGAFDAVWRCEQYDVRRSPAHRRSR